MVHSMMFFKKVQLMCWVDAVLCVVYIKNRCPSDTIRKHFRVFSSTCYALIPKEQINKLGARIQKYIFLGYSNTSKGYRLYDEVNKNFIVSRDVIFLESSKTDNVVDT